MVGTILKGAGLLVLSYGLAFIAGFFIVIFLLAAGPAMVRERLLGHTNPPPAAPAVVTATPGPPQATPTPVVLALPSAPPVTPPAATGQSFDPPVVAHPSAGQATPVPTRHPALAANPSPTVAARGAATGAVATSRRPPVLPGTLVVPLSSPTPRR